MVRKAGCLAACEVEVNPSQSGANRRELWLLEEDLMGVSGFFFANKCFLGGAFAIFGT